MSTKIMSSIKDENRDLRKQIGCMNGIFQLFDRHHFLIGRRISGHNHKKLLPGSQYQQDTKYATNATSEKDVVVQKEKPRISTESSRASFSSSSCSSTFSSLDCNRTSQPETLPLKKVNTALDIREVVKDSMHREARFLSIKSSANDEEGRGRAMKHIDSPRPPQQSKSEKKTKTTSQEVPSPRVLTKDDRLALPRFSYDGRESREMLKSGTKHKELLPRLSLDSKPRSNFLLQVGKNEKSSQLVHPLNQEPETQNRPSSVVAKLMGLEAFPDESSGTPTIKSGPKEDSLSQSTPRLNKGDSVKKPNTCSRFPMESAPWRQQDSGQDSPKTPSQNRKAPKNNTTRLSSSVYGEIEKRITGLEFKKSGKDLRALKQILEAMQKTRERLETQREDSSLVIVKNPAKVVDKVVISVPARVPTSEISHLQRIQTRDRKYPRENSSNRQKAREITPKNNNLKNPSRIKVENCTTSGRSYGSVSPRLQQNLLRIEGQSRPTTPISESGRVKRDYSKKLTEKVTRNRKVKPKDLLQLSDDQSSELSYTASVKSESNNSLVSQMETEVTSLVRSINTNAREKEDCVSTTRMVTLLEQPSPISVLDDAFYDEDSPSPVKKISTAFRDESSSHDEVEWHLENLNRELRLSKTEPVQTAANHQELAYVSLNPNHRYINKILLTTGLLKDSSFISTTDQLLSSRHVINPDMFDVLEQTEEITEGANQEYIEKNERMKLSKKTERKIIFDMVNEILVRKISTCRFFKVGKKKTTPQGLLEEVYSGMDRASKIADKNLDDEDDEMIRLLAADMMCPTEDWADYGGGEIPALVLDIERLIFKDLINEVVTGEVTGAHDWPKRHCRQLFSK